MLKASYWFLLFLFLFAAAPAAQATHLVGGSLSYEAAGKNNGYFVYKVKLVMYRDCKNSSVGFDGSIGLSIYHNNTNKSLIRTKTIFFKSESLVTPPPGTGNCTFDPNVCLSEGTYEDTIMVSSSSVGYHLYYARCCRNAPQNLIDDQGQTYYAFIPETDTENSSPEFSGVPAPYICATDEATLFNIATDADGDSLVYSIIRPLHGGSQTDPIPNPSSFLPDPLPQVTYANGYNTAKPFGNNSFATIDGTTGLTTLKSPGAGHYALAVEVKEYRNGVYLGRVIRDVQIIVLNCPPNPMPRLTSPNGSSPSVSYEIEEGELLKFDVMVTDADSMYMKRNGNIFTSVQAPLATLSPVAGKDTIISRFNWQTTCGHGSNTPYIFTVQVKDNGCPGKTLNITYSITVRPHEPSKIITGPDTVCAFTGNIAYSTPVAQTGSSWSWLLTGGNITSPKDKRNITVDFEQATKARLSMVAISPYDCMADTVYKDIAVLPLPVADAGADKTFCSGDTVTLGPAAPQLSYSYQWLTTSGLNNKNIANPALSLTNPGTFPVVAEYRLRVSDKYCSSKDSITVTVNPRPKALPVTGDAEVCYQSTTGYSVKRTTGSTYHWWAEGGNITSGNGSNTVQVKWHTAGANKLFVAETNNLGCLGDTAIFNVSVLKASTDTAFGSDVVCPNSSMVKYWVNATPGSEYFWDISGGTIALGGTSSQIRVNWGDSGTAHVKVVEVNSIGCIGDTVHFPVVISYRLKTKPIQGPAQVCEGLESVTYSVQGTNGSAYAWMIKGGTVLSGNGTDSVTVDWGAEGKGELSVLETSFDQVNNLPCKGDTVKLDVQINPMPETSLIAGPAAICALIEVTYSVKGFNSSRFIWSISSDHTFTDNGSSIVVTWAEPGIYIIKVFEVSEDSCVGEVKQLTVEVYSVPETSDIIGPEIVCVPDGKGITYSVKGLENSEFKWKTDNGLITGGQGTDEIKVDWNPSGAGKVSMIETTPFGCIGDTIIKKVVLDAPELHIDFVSTVEENEKVIQMEWRVVNGENLTSPVNIWRKPDIGTNWEIVETVQHDVTSFKDDDVKTQRAFYQYYLQSMNLCNKSFASVPHNSLLLTGAQPDKGLISLNWNGYNGWPQNASYQVMRRLNERQFYEVYHSTTDTVLHRDVGLDGYEQCYRIRAVSNEDPEVVSWSNEVCFTFDAVVWIPNAFTPNPSPNLNDEFKIQAGNYKTLEIRIFNRWGECIFRGSNSGHSWDGTYNGHPVPEGIYTYTVEVENSREKKVYRGSITLIR